MARKDARTVGQDAERLALRFLKKKGLTPVTQNYRCRLGEIDLVMLNRDCLVFVEVRFRIANRFASARLSVDSHKQRKIIKTAAVFLSQNRHYALHTVRFDVVAVNKESIEWIRDAFRPADCSL